MRPLVSFWNTTGIPSRRSITPHLTGMEPTEVWGADASNTPYLRAVTINNKAKKLDLTSNEAFESFIKDENTDAYDSDFLMFRWNTKTHQHDPGRKDRRGRQDHGTLRSHPGERADTRRP